MLVTNDIIIHLDRKTHCATMFVDLSKASDSLEQTLLLGRLSDVGLGDCVQELACGYISDCVYTDGYKSSFLDSPPRLNFRPVFFYF